MLAYVINQNNTMNERAAVKSCFMRCSRVTIAVVFAGKGMGVSSYSAVTHAGKGEQK